jgi:hypothetical protein
MISFALFIDSDNYRWCGTEREAAYEEVRAWLLVPARAEEGILAQLLREMRDPHHVKELKIKLLEVFQEASLPPLGLQGHFDIRFS